MSLVAQQLPALIGVLVGALASYLSSAVAERRRWRRESHVRWDQTRMRAYAAYAGSVKSMTQVADRVCAARGLGSRAEPMEPDVGLERLAEAEAVRGAAWEDVLLLGDPATIAAARRWHEHVWELEHLARGHDDDPARWAATMTAVIHARDEFYAYARRSLDIAGRPSAPGLFRFRPAGPEPAVPADER